MREVPGDNANHHFFDRYTVPHAAVGMVFEASRIPAWLAVGSHVVFEATENSIKDAVHAVWPDASPDAWENHVGDVASFTAGFCASRLLRGAPAGRAALTGFVALAAGVWMWNLSRPTERTR